MLKFGCSNKIIQHRMGFGSIQTFLQKTDHHQACRTVGLDAERSGQSLSSPLLDQERHLPFQGKADGSLFPVIKRQNFHWWGGCLDNFDQCVDVVILQITKSETAVADQLGQYFWRYENAIE